jgi:F-type H+-transporting ATPase subunit delta
MDAAQANQQLRGFADMLAGSAELHNALTSPAVSPARKRAVVKRLADQLGLAKMVRNFLLVLSDHRRLAALAPMIDSFEILLDARLGFVRAELSSAREMDERQKAALGDELSRLTG